MGVKFSKEMVLAKDLIAPAQDRKADLTPIQEKLVKKFGANAFPFRYDFPASSPSSVVLQPGEEDSGKPLGVEYTVKCFVADHDEDRGHKRSSVSLAIKKVISIYVQPSP